MSDPAFAAYNGKEFALPSGKKVQAKPLNFIDAIRAMELLSQFKAGAAPMPETIGKLAAEFPAMIGLVQDDLIEMTLAEFLQVLDDFLAYSRPGFIRKRSEPANPPISLSA